MAFRFSHYSRDVSQNRIYWTPIAHFLNRCQTCGKPQQNLCRAYASTLESWRNSVLWNIFLRHILIWLSSIQVWVFSLLFHHDLRPHYDSLREAPRTKGFYRSPQKGSLEEGWAHALLCWVSFEVYSQVALSRWRTKTSYHVQHYLWIMTESLTEWEHSTVFSKLDLRCQLSS